MQDNSNSNCSGGLEVVQFVKKRTYSGVKISPYKATLGTVLKVDTSTNSLSKNVVDMITVQDNLKTLWR
jgi:hypothetical protein